MASYPTSSSDNPNFSFTRDGDGNATQIDMTVSGPRGLDVVYRLTLVWTNGNVDTISKWVLQP